MAESEKKVKFPYSYNIGWERSFSFFVQITHRIHEKLLLLYLLYFIGNI